MDFQPKNRSDIRFAGLIDTTDAEFNDIRDGINAKLERVLTAILSGQEPDAVYALWRALNADDVEAARRRHEAPATAHPVPVGILDGAREAVAATSSLTRAGGGDDVHLAVHLPADGQDALAVLIESVARQASRGVHVGAHAEGGDGDARAWPRSSPTSRSRSCRRTGSARTCWQGTPATSPRDLDLLVLSELLPSVDRVVVLPVDAVVADDIAELYDIDLGGDLVAAPTVVGTTGSSGFGVIHHAALRLGKTATATELRRRAYARHTFDFDAFTPTSWSWTSRGPVRRASSTSACRTSTVRADLAPGAPPGRGAGPDRAARAVGLRADALGGRPAGRDPLGRPGQAVAEDYTAERERWLELAETVKKRRTS